MANNEWVSELYCYRPLTTPTTIRVLLLYPGEQFDPLVGFLRHLDIGGAYPTPPRDDKDALHRPIERPDYDPTYDEDAEHFGYEALSYVWGVATGTCVLHCSEGTDIPLTPNLDVALRRVRFEDRIRVIWADAICINQKNLQERGTQVELMKDIYQKAQQVIVWLGYTNAENASEVFAYLRVGEAYMYDHKNSIARLDRLVRDRRMNSLFSSQWFNRLWVVQELYQSARASCFWGDEQIDFTYITAAHMRYNESPQWLDLCTRRSGLPLPLVKLLHLTQHLQCSDDRDRVYAFLALIHKSGYQIKPDYTKSAEQVYRAAALADATDWDIAQDGSPSLLNWFPFTLLGVDHPYGWDPQTSKASSWLPEWSEKLPLPIFQNIGPKFVAMPTAFFSERNLQSVVVEGCMFDNIDFVTESDIPCTKLVDTLQYVSAFWNDHVELWRMLFPLDRDVLNYRFLGALCCAEIDWAELQKHGQKRKKGRRRRKETYLRVEGSRHV